MSEQHRDRLELDDLTEDWAAVKLLPRHTNLQRAVWITENQGYPHDVRVKVSRVKSGSGRWTDSISVTVRPNCEEVGRLGQLPTDELADICAWIALNRDVIVEFWDGVITFDEVALRLRRLP